MPGSAGPYDNIFSASQKISMLHGDMEDWKPGETLLQGTKKQEVRKDHNELDSKGPSIGFWTPRKPL